MDSWEINSKSSSNSSNDYEQSLLDSQEEAQESLPCDICLGDRVNLQKSKEGYVVASVCSCIESSDRWDFIEKYRYKAKIVSAAEIPNRFISSSKGSLNREDISSWINDLITGSPVESMIFFHGDVGTGKTHTAIHALFKALLSGHEVVGYYISLLDLLTRRQSYLDSKFSPDEHERHHYRREYLWYLERVRDRDFVVLDEIGQGKINPSERRFLFDLLDTRHALGKTTILISNHSGSSQPGGKSLIKMIGKPLTSRVESGKIFNFVGFDRRLEESSTSISKQEIKSFVVPAKIFTHNDNTQQIMTWLTRNPAFQSISTLERKSLTYIDPNGEEKDKDRNSASFYKDVWIEGDSLTINGPMCDHEDKKLYAILLKELANSHSRSVPGLELETSYGHILTIQGKTDGGKQFEILRRQLDRLARMSLSFRSANGAKWVGALITALAEKGEGRTRKVMLTFNPYMIAFYRASAYTTFSHDLSEKIIGDGSAFYLFFVSHDKAKRLNPVPFEKCKKLLGMPEDISRKAALRRISKATKDLVSYDILCSSTKFINNSLHPTAGSAL